jgi:hypothetical protein
MTIDSRWLRKDFKQKYFLYCPFSEFKVNKFAHIKNNNYICKIIKIEEL